MSRPTITLAFLGAAALAWSSGCGDEAAAQQGGQGGQPAAGQPAQPAAGQGAGAAGGTGAVSRPPTTTPAPGTVSRPATAAEPGTIERPATTGQPGTVQRPPQAPTVVPPSSTIGPAPLEPSPIGPPAPGGDPGFQPRVDGTPGGQPLPNQQRIGGEPNIRTGTVEDRIGGNPNIRTDPTGGDPSVLDDPEQARLTPTPNQRLPGEPEESMGAGGPGGPGRIGGVGIGVDPRGVDPRNLAPEAIGGVGGFLLPWGGYVVVPETDLSEPFREPPEQRGNYYIVESGGREWAVSPEEIDQRDAAEGQEERAR